MSEQEVDSVERARKMLYNGGSFAQTAMDQMQKNLVKSLEAQQSQQVNLGSQLQKAETKQK